MSDYDIWVFEEVEQLRNRKLLLDMKPTNVVYHDIPETDNAEEKRLLQTLPVPLDV